MSPNNFTSDEGDSSTSSLTHPLRVVYQQTNPPSDLNERLARIFDLALRRYNENQSIVESASEQSLPEGEAQL